MTAKATKKGWGKKHGFTLVELLVSMLLTFVMLGAVYSFYRVQARTLKVQQARLDVQESARIAMEMMVREIRNTGFAPTGAGCAGVVTADVQSVRFRYDANADGDCADPGEDVIYALDGEGCPAGYGNVTRKDGANSPEALTNCNAPVGADKFSFAYFSQDASTAYPTPVVSGELGNIRKVVIQLTVQSPQADPVFGGQLTAALTSHVGLPNRGLP